MVANTTQVREVFDLKNTHLLLTLSKKSNECQTPVMQGRHMAATDGTTLSS